MWITEPNYVTFITPSLGRKSLSTAITSILRQSDWNWKSIIIFDGTDPIALDGGFDYLNDNHFTVLRTEERLYNAGLVRNIALPLVDTDWIAFLDDDDYLADTYIESLKRYNLNYPDIDIFVFTYRDVTNGNTQPPNNIDTLVRCNVGISFAVRTNFVHNNNIVFPAGGVEDFAFLNDCVNNGARYLITHDIQYYVNGRGVWK